MAIESAPNAALPRHRADEVESTLPSAVRIGLSRIVPELKMFYRRPEQLALTFTMPAVICLLLGAIFSAKVPGTEISTGAVIAASMLAYGILSTSFINLGIGIAADRETGALRRLRGTPATASSYFIGKIALVAIASLAEAVIILSVGRTGLRPPPTGGPIRMVHIHVGVHPGNHQLLTTGHLRQQSRQQCRFCSGHHQRPGCRLAVRVRHLRAAHGVTDVDVDRRIVLSGQMDGSGISVGAVAAADGCLRTGWQLGTLADLPGSDRVEHRRSAGVPARVPLVR